jgi:copper homeostasis protein
MKIEICAGSLVSALNAQRGGAHRVELCASLDEGGVTPSPATILLAKKHLQIPVFVLIRPRSGDFLYSDEEFELMKEDVVFCKENRIDGVVLGILTAEGDVDMNRTRELIQLARPMQVTFHRAFDLTIDPFQSLEDIIRCGAARILTSGQTGSAISGADLISELIQKADNRIVIMPGSGITEHNAVDLVRKTRAEEIHASLRSPVNSAMIHRNTNASMGKAGSDEFAWRETDTHRVSKLLKRLKMRPETRNPEPGTWNPEPGTWNPEPGTRNPEPGTRN